MLKHHAELIAELLTNAGWLDDADELLMDIANSDGHQAAVEKADEVKSLMVEINQYLPVDQRFTINQMNLHRHL